MSAPLTEKKPLLSIAGRNRCRSMPPPLFGTRVSSGWARAGAAPVAIADAASAAAMDRQKKVLVVRIRPLPPHPDEHLAELLDLGRPRHIPRVKADLGEEREPCRPGEHALYMAVMTHAHLAALPEE